MIGEHIGINTPLEIVPERTVRRVRFHFAKNILDAGEQDIDSPELVT
jgi:hypothetical protein